jgi:hypothetical protein
MLHQITLKSGYNIKIQYATLPALHANSTNIPLPLMQTDDHQKPENTVLVPKIALCSQYTMNVLHAPFQNSK